MEPNSNHLFSIIIPCYNEASTISEVVRRIIGHCLPSPWEKEVIIVDDGSLPETKSVLSTLPTQGRDTSVRVIYKPENEGKGAAVKDGLRVARGELCIIQDSDLELDPSEYSALLKPILSGDADSVFGYRVLRNARSHKNFFLFYGGRLLSMLYNLLFHSKFKDIPCCYKVFPRRFINDLLRAPSDDFVFDAIEMTRILHRGGAIAEVPVTYTPRSRGEGKKIRWHHGMYGALAIIFMRLGIHYPPIIKNMPKVFRFLITGTASFVVNISLFFILTHYLKVDYLTASPLAFFGSWIVNFNLHKFWTFSYKHERGTLSQMILHGGLMLINVTINTFMVYIFVDYIGVNSLIAQGLAAILIAMENFFLLSRFIFKEI